MKLYTDVDEIRTTNKVYYMQRVSGISKGYVVFVLFEGVAGFCREPVRLRCALCTLQLNSVLPLARINRFPATPNYPSPLPKSCSW